MRIELENFLPQNKMEKTCLFSNILDTKKTLQERSDSRTLYLRTFQSHSLSHEDKRFQQVRDILTQFAGKWLNKSQVEFYFKEFAKTNSSMRKNFKILWCTRSLPVMYDILGLYIPEFVRFLRERQQGPASKEQENQSQNAQNDISENQIESSSENWNDILHAISPISSSDNSNAFPNDNNDDQNYINQNANIPLPGDDNAVQNANNLLFDGNDATQSDYSVFSDDTTDYSNNVILDNYLDYY